MPRLLRAVFAVLALGVVAHGAHAVLGFGGAPATALFDTWIYTGVEFGAVALCLARAVTMPRRRAPWILFTLSLTFWATGDLLWLVWTDHLNAAPVPNVADALYFASYPATYAGLLLLLRDRLRHFRRSLWLDGAIAALAAAGVAVALLLGPIVAATHGAPGLVATTLAYPVFDLLVMGFIGVGFALTGWRPDRMLLALGAGQLLTSVADAIYTYQESVGSYHGGTLLDTMWPAAFLLTAAAAWQPVRTRPADDHGWLSALPAALAAAVALGLLILDQFRPVGRLAALLAAAALAFVMVRAGLMWWENVGLLRRTHREANRDGLSGLRNRRALMVDLADAAATATPVAPCHLAFFDLDGFKGYNDAFGHAAGDGLLRRLALRLETATAGHGTAYRLGGDEFCALLRIDGAAVVAAAALALSDHGTEFAISTSYGVVELPADTGDPADALRLADERMYAHKRGGRLSTRRQARDVLMAVLTEREPDLCLHADGVTARSLALADRLGIEGEELDVLGRAAELHDIGKVAVPGAILHKPGPLNDEEWALIREHSVVGERIVGAAPALRPVARLIRASHERWDGEGYPDRLAGEEIPLGARVIAVCDAYDAMVNDRSYRRAMPPAKAEAELARGAGTQFDPWVVEAFLAEPLPTPQRPNVARSSKASLAEAIMNGHGRDLSRVPDRRGRVRQMDAVDHP